MPWVSSTQPVVQYVGTDRLQIRRAKPDDAAQIISGIDVVCNEGGAFYTTQFVTNAQWQAALYEPESVPDYLLAVAECDNSFAGAAQVFPGPEHTLFRHVGELGIFVQQRFRRQGIGRGLLNWLLEHAAKNGLEKITLSVFSTNAAARALYREFDFVVEGRRRRQFKIGNSYVDEILMAHYLGSLSEPGTA